MDRTKVLYGPRTQIYEETNYFEKTYKFWIEPRSCMVLGLKPMGKPTTLRKSKFLTEPRSCMVLRLKPMGKPTSLRKSKFLTKSRSCMILGLKPMAKPTTLRKTISFGQNQGLAWSSDSNLWGNQLL